MGGGQSVRSVEEGVKDHKFQSVFSLKREADASDGENIEGLTRLITAESQRKKDILKDDYDVTKENMQVLKHLFKKMDPTIMQTSADSVHGEIELSFKYDVSSELILVKVIRCLDLSAKDLRGKSADPFVKLFIYGSERMQEACVTHVMKKTLNPVYHEIFTFKVSQDQLATDRLIVQVWDKDVMARDDFIGEAVVPFSSFNFSENVVHTTWYDLKAKTNLNIGGEIEVTLAYQLPSLLQVTIHRGSNLTDMFPDRKPNPFVKLQVPGTKNVHHTKVEHGTVNPVWEETFEFDIPSEEFEQRYIIFHVLDYDDADDNESMGQVIIDLNNFDPDSGYHGNFQLADMRNRERLRSKWFQQVAAQEFREALIAHAEFRQPKFLFQQHTGSKVIRVRSKKTGCQAKLYLVNGIPVY